MPLEAVQKILFSLPTLSADDIAKIIVPVYDEGYNLLEQKKCL